MYARFSTFIPKSIILSFKSLLAYNNIDMDENKFVGFVFIYGLFLGIGLAANALLFFALSPLMVFFVSFLGFVFLIFLFLKMKSEAKGKAVEAVLPDALRLIASNMKSGLTTERSLFVAARPEFGALQIELRNASKRIASGEQVEEALKGISDNINSESLKKTIWLISQGIRSGGQIANLLCQLSDDLKDQQSLDAEISSNISIYILLILFSAIAGAPLLFGISSFIVEVITSQLANTMALDVSSVPATGNLAAIKGFVSGGQSLISAGFIVFFSIVMLVFTTLFSALTIGVINNGKETGGIKFILPMLVGAFVLFFAARILLTQVFGNLI